MAMLLITHDMGVVAGHTDRINVMYAGRIVESTDTHDAVRPHAPPVHAGAARLDSRGSPRTATSGSTASPGYRRTWPTRRSAAGSLRAAHMRAPGAGRLNRS